MTHISERKTKEDEVIEESRIMLTSVFDELTQNQVGIGQSLKDGLRIDKIVGTCEKCGSELINSAWPPRLSLHRLLRLSELQVHIAATKVWDCGGDGQAM